MRRPSLDPRRVSSHGISVGMMLLVCLAFCPNVRADDRAMRQPGVLMPPRSSYVHFMIGAAIGDSIRFNNPYRLANQLGESAESLSRTPVYTTLSGLVTAGDPDGWQHGGALQWSRSLSGLPQHVVVPSYAVMQAAWRPWLAFGRVGAPVVLNPDPNLGIEVGLGAVYLLTAGLGLYAEWVGDLFYGAATWDRARTPIPLLSFQAGFAVDFERLP